MKVSRQSLEKGLEPDGGISPCCLHMLNQVNCRSALYGGHCALSLLCYKMWRKKFAYASFSISICSCTALNCSMLQCHVNSQAADMAVFSCPWHSASGLQ